MKYSVPCFPFCPQYTLIEQNVNIKGHSDLRTDCQSLKPIFPLLSLQPKYLQEQALIFQNSVLVYITELLRYILEAEFHGGL